MTIGDFCVFGDSIGKGVVFNPNNNRYSLAEINWEKLFGKVKVNIKNYARFGCTVAKGLTMVKKHAQELIGYEKILVELGGNDCDFIWKEIAADPEKEHLPKTPVEEFRHLYQQVIEVIQVNKGKPIILNLPPLDPQRYFDWISRGLDKINILKWLGDVEMIYRWQEMYNVEVMMLATRLKVPIIDIRSAFLKHNNYREFLCEDGIHPNIRGYELIYRTISEQI
ncbi:MAG: SGNH/GDSL hydrolase family protein [Clostridiales bacterium]|nr:SGNH/GDSL hydrolase family protein [Clostridiales bacterium]